MNNLPNNLLPTTVSPTTVGIAFAALVLAAIVFEQLGQVVWRFIVDAIIMQPVRKKIFTSSTSLKAGVVTLQIELKKYQAALLAVTSAGISDINFNANLAELKKETAKLGLPKIDNSKFLETMRKFYPKYRPVIYSDLQRRTEILSGYCNVYREFFAEINGMRLDDLEDFKLDVYHSAASLKPDIEYASTSRIRSNGDRAIRYLFLFDRIIQSCLREAALLEADLDIVIRKNKFGEIRAALVGRIVGA